MNSTTEQILTPTHPRWPEFCVRMQQLNPEGGCNHFTTDFAFEVLNVMGADIDGTLDYMRRRRARCDCEIIFNVILPSLDAMQ